MNAGSRADHNRFCLHEGWEVVRDARGRAVGHHVTYELLLHDGTILRTRISHPVNTVTYGTRLWRTILRHQLVVSEKEFWDCVRDGTLPDRGQDDDSPPERALPAGLAYQLIHVAHVPEGEVMAMTPDQAIARMTEHWSRPGPA